MTDVLLEQDGWFRWFFRLCVSAPSAAPCASLDWPPGRRRALLRGEATWEPDPGGQVSSWSSILPVIA